MIKTVSKCYPVFEEQIFRSGRNTHWSTKEDLPPIPTRFGAVYSEKGINSSEENFVSFGTDVALSDDMRRTSQEGFRVYESKLVIADRQQLRGNLPRGDVDFYIYGATKDTLIELESGGALMDPQTGESIRYPYRMATYYPVHNILIIKTLTRGTKTQSMYDFLGWLFEEIESIGYKYYKGEHLLIGCDPEFSITDMLDERIPANAVFPDPDRNKPIGTDGTSSTGELRPRAADCPIKLTDNIRKLMRDIARKLPTDRKILTGGGGNMAPLGHHIHFSRMISSEEIELLDEFVGKPALKIDGAKRPNGEYESIGRSAVRRQPHGCEYRTPASSLIPELTNALHVTAYCCLMKWESLGEKEAFKFEIDDKSHIPTLEAYLSLDITPNKKYTPYLEEYWKWVNRKEGRKIDPKRDCLHFWVENRAEVKPRPGIKVNWAPGIFPSVSKEAFIPIPLLDKIYEITVFEIPTGEDACEIQICTPEEIHEQISVRQVKELKVKYEIDSVLGYFYSSLRIGFNKNMVTKLRTMKRLKSLVMDIAKLICV